MDISGLYEKLKFRFHVTLEYEGTPENQISVQHHGSNFSDKRKDKGKKKKEKIQTSKTYVLSLMEISVYNCGTVYVVEDFSSHTFNSLSDE